MAQLDIHVVGFNKQQEEVLEGLIRHFGLTEDAALRFLSSVPRVARHCASRPEAQAYERALMAVGAVVELRPAQTLMPARSFDVPSLPAPPVASPSASPSIVNFDSSAQLAERIPRAPAVPAEAWTQQRRLEQEHLNRQPSQQDLNDPLLIRDDLGLSSEFFSDSPESDNASISPQRGQLRRTAISSSSPTNHRYGTSSLGPATLNSTRQPNARSFRSTRSIALILVLISVAAGVGYLRWDDSGAQQERKWKEAGISYGIHEPAETFIKEGTLAGMGTARTRDLVAALKITGATDVHALRITRSENGPVAAELLIVLPEAASQRDALLWLQARMQNSAVRITEDVGQPYLVITGTTSGNRSSTAEDCPAGPDCGP